MFLQQAAVINKYDQFTYFVSHTKDVKQGFLVKLTFLNLSDSLTCWRCSGGGTSWHTSHIVRSFIVAVILGGALSLFCMFC